MARSVVVLPPALLARREDAYRAALAGKRRTVLLGALLVAVALAVSMAGSDVDIGKFVRNIGNFTSYFDRLLVLDSGARVWTDPLEWFWGIRRWMRLLFETMLIAYVGTISGALVALAAGFCASRNLVASPWVRMTLRRVLEALRTVPDLVFALVFVAAFGLGPLPGVLALALHSAGTLGKLFSETVETIDMRPVEGIAAAGGSWLAGVRFGVVPQVLSSFTSYTLLRLETNLRGATVIGFVGAGGIGTDLLTAIRKFYYADVSAMLLMIVVSVSLLDIVSEWIRHRLLSDETPA